VLTFVFLVVFLAFCNLSGFPEFLALDEGFRLYFIKHVVRYGRWAILTQDGFHAYWRDSTGPVVLLPIMALFALFEPSLILARSVMGALLVLGTLIVYRSMRDWYDSRIALLAVWLWLFFGPPWLNTVTMGRWVYGELPALGFFILGCWRWSRAATGSSRAMVVAWIAFVLAVWSKDLFAPMIVATLTIVWLAHRHEYLARSFLIVPSLLCIAAFALWSGFQIVMSWAAGVTATGQYDLLQLSLSRIIVFSPTLWWNNLKFLYEHNLLVVFPLALYALAVRPPRRVGSELLIVFVLIWMAWYAGGSIGWPRYAYPIWAIGGILLAVALGDLMEWTRNQLVCSQHRPTKLALVALVISILIIVLVWPAQNTVRRVFEPVDTAAITMATYIDANVPPVERIVSGQWEVHMYSDRLFIPIPEEYYAVKIAEQIGKTLELPAMRSITDLQATYLLDGSENRVVEMEPPDRLHMWYEPVFQVGTYCLYRLKRFPDDR